MCAALAGAQFMFSRRTVHALGLTVVAMVSVPLAGCTGGSGTASLNEAVTAPEDGLAQAYGIFKGLFTQQGEDQHHHIGFGYHPGLSTQKLLGVTGTPVNGQATIHFATDGRGTAGT